MIKFLSRSLLAAVLLTGIVACAVRAGDYYADTRVKLDNEAEISHVSEYRGHYLIFSWKNGALYLFDKSGASLAEYDHPGKGPGELTPMGAEFLGVSGDTIYLSDNRLNKVVMIGYDDADGCFVYRDEFPVNEGALRAGFVDGSGHIIVYTGDYLMYDADGALLKRYESDSLGKNNVEKSIDRMRWILPDNDGFYAVSYMNYNMRRFDYKDGFVKERCCFRPAHIYVPDNYTLKKSDSGEYSLTGGVGVYGSAVLDGNLCVMLRPEDDKACPDLQVYDKDGRYLGTRALNTRPDRRPLYIAGRLGTDPVIVECGENGDPVQGEFVIYRNSTGRDTQKYPEISSLTMNE